MIPSLSSYPSCGFLEYFFCCVVFYHMERRWKVSQDFAWVLALFISERFERKRTPFLQDRSLSCSYWLCYAVLVLE